MVEDPARPSELRFRPHANWSNTGSSRRDLHPVYRMFPRTLQTRPNWQLSSTSGENSFVCAYQLGGEKLGSTPAQGRRGCKARNDCLYVAHRVGRYKYESAKYDEGTRIQAHPLKKSQPPQPQDRILNHSVVRSIMCGSIPKFSRLPLNPGDPPFSAWGVYGKNDEVGTINRLTNDIVLAAKDEIQTADRFSLNWPLNALGSNTFIGRKNFHLEQWQKAPRIVNDDIWTFNSQGSTQWDGLRHFAYQKEAKFYNGVTLDDMFEEDRRTKKCNVNGIEKWEEHGIVGRGILIDYDRWRRAQGIEYIAMPSNTKTAIPLEHLKACLKDQGTEIHFGDILILRTGYTAAYEKASETERELSSKSTTASGVEQTEETLQWIWDNFSAVAGDHIAFEQWPSSQEWYMHEVLLAGWGMPIGEFFYLEKLAEHCQKVDRWSFFLTSEVRLFLSVTKHDTHCD